MKATSRGRKDKSGKSARSIFLLLVPGWMVLPTACFDATFADSAVVFLNACAKRLVRTSHFGNVRHTLAKTMRLDTTSISSRMRLLCCIAVGLLAISWAGVARSLQAHPFNAAIYKSSHNSYDRDESLAQQIDDYNIWQIELDLCTSDEGLKVSHTCDPATLNSANTLQSWLAALLADSKTYTQKFTVIYFDLKQNWDDDGNSDDNQNVHNEIVSTIKHYLGTHLYTPAKLASVKQWPSFKDLNGSGFYWAVIVDWHGADHTPDAAKANGDLFTVATHNPPDPALEFSSAVLVNVDGGCDAAPNRDNLPSSRGKWLYRYWPSCAQDCQQMNGNYWNTGVAKGYSFVATNCVNWDHTFQPPTQSPQPLFVDQTAMVSCPKAYSSCEWGTLHFPFHDLNKALQRVSPLTTISIHAGTYTLAPTAELMLTPMTLTESGGPVIMK